MDNMFALVVIIYLIFHIPAFGLLILGFICRKSKPRTSKILLIIACVYFLIGAGICGTILNS